MSCGSLACRLTKYRASRQRLTSGWPAHAPAEAAELATSDAPEPTYEQIGEDWIGFANGRRTMLKSSLEWAQLDVANERYVCAAWPGCRHRDADECTRMTRRLPRWRADEDYR